MNYTKLMGGNFSTLRTLGENTCVVEGIFDACCNHVSVTISEGFEF